MLRALDFTTVVVGQLDADAEVVAARREGIRQSLVDTVQAHHVAWNDVAGNRLTAIKSALAEYRAVFTTSYDLIFYWAVNHDGADGFVDYLWNAGGAFDPLNVQLHAPSDVTAMHWLHGGLHLYRDGIDGTAKGQSGQGANLLQQFAEGDRLPLYVAEGDADQKRAAIRRSDYLDFCLDRLTEDSRPLVIFGQALGPSDAHLVEAISRHAQRPLAYRIYPTTETGVQLVKAATADRFERTDIAFFDSTTHPLGAATLAV